MTQQDLSDTIETGQVELIQLEVGKLDIQPGDVLVIRTSHGMKVSRAEAARVRAMVLECFQEAGFEPAILFVDGYELAVIRPKNGGSHAN